MGFLPTYEDLEKHGLFLEERRESLVIGSDDEGAFGRVEFMYEAIDPLIAALEKTRSRQSKLARVPIRPRYNMGSGSD